MNKIIFSIVLALSFISAHAETSTAGSSSGSMASTENTNNPVFNIQSAPSNTRSDWHTNQAATAGTVFVNPPSGNTGAKPGSGLSVQAVGGGAAFSAGGEESESCEARQDLLTLKFINAPVEVQKARACMSKNLEEAFARAGMPCEDKRPQPAKDEPRDPYVRNRLGLK